MIPGRVQQIRLPPAGRQPGGPGRVCPTRAYLDRQLSSNMQADIGKKITSYNIECFVFCLQVPLESWHIAHRTVDRHLSRLSFAGVTGRIMGLLTRRRRVLHVFLIVSLVWICTLLYTYSVLDMSIGTLVGNLLKRPVENERLHQLMSGDEFPDDEPVDPLSKIVMSSENLLHFYHLPKRKRDVSYTEITSANRDTSYPLAPDFSFHVRYLPDRVVLYEDYGPGCIYRLYLFPVLPTSAQELHRLTSKDLYTMYLHINVDGKSFKFTLQQVMEGKVWPFLYPLNTRHPRPASGMGSYAPMCYQNSITVSYIHRGAFPDNLLNVNINCTMQDLPCPVHVYSAVSRHKYPYGTKVVSMAESSHERSNHKELLKTAASLLSNVEHDGPDYGQVCTLKCTEICRQCIRPLLLHWGDGVVSSIKIRVFETATGKIQPDWNQIYLTASFDHSLTPQIRVSLGTLFGASGSMNDFKGAAIGRRKKYCLYDDAYLDLPKTEMTGYLYLPMPFWQKAEISIEGAPSISTSYSVCYQVNVEQNHYAESKTGYLHAKQTHYSSDVGGYREVLSLQASWGHIVGLYMDVDNLKAVRDVPLAYRWAALQADAVLYIDGQQSASVMGTGLEDYFSYAHGFALAENTTYSFVGVYHSGPRQSEPLTWYCYRQHVLDPIPFHNSVHFVMEGTARERFFLPETPLSEDEFYRRRIRKESLLSHMVVYYAKPNKAGMTLIDNVILGDEDSESNHRFRMLRSSSKYNDFHLPHKHYLGACIRKNRQTF